ncbi:MAG: hypothetical protein R6U78_16800, partial [Bacteroidales bacterium]
SINLKQGEAKTVTFTIRDSSNALVDCSSASVQFAIKLDKGDLTYKVNKSDSSFTKTNAANGVLTLVLNATDTNQLADDYIGELYLWTSATNKDKSDDITVTIEEAVIN